MQDTNGKPIKLKGKPGEFKAQDFTTSNFGTTEDKATWANKFTKFILGGFQKGSFNKKIYSRLHMMFGHCAEYDINGFYVTWFEGTNDCLRWVEHVTTTWLAGIGDPRFTWSDVEKKLIQWIQDNNIHDQVGEYLQQETEAHERATLAALQSRYGVVPIANANATPVETEDLTADPTPVQIEIPAPVQELGQLRLF